MNKRSFLKRTFEAAAAVIVASSMEVLGAAKEVFQSPKVTVLRMLGLSQRVAKWDHSTHQCWSTRNGFQVKQDETIIEYRWEQDGPVFFSKDEAIAYAEDKGWRHSQTHAFYEEEVTDAELKELQSRTVEDAPKREENASLYIKRPPIQTEIRIGKTGKPETWEKEPVWEYKPVYAEINPLTGRLNIVK